jgi:hypothetical protein
MEPTRARTISTAIDSLVMTSPKRWPDVRNRRSSGSDAPA